MKDRRIDDICDILDATIFTGDMFIDNEERAEFRELMARWERRMVEFDEMCEGTRPLGPSDPEKKASFGLEPLDLR